MNWLRKRLLVLIIFLIPFNLAVCFSKHKNNSSLQSKTFISMVDTNNVTQLNQQQQNQLIEFLSFLQPEVEQKNLDCMHSFGDKKFCNCLVNALPIGMSIVEYVYLVTLSANDYEKIYFSNNDDLKAAIMKAQTGRDKCILP